MPVVTAGPVQVHRPAGGHRRGLASWSGVPMWERAAPTCGFQRPGIKVCASEPRRRTLLLAKATPT